MFTELVPLLAERTLLLTIAKENDSLLRVNIIPKAVNGKETETGERALATPLTIVGTADELDRNLPRQLSEFASSVIETHSTLATVKKTHEAAVKAVEAENKQALEAKRGKGSTTKAADKTKADAANAPVFKDNKPVFGSKGGGSLFDSLPAADQTDSNESCEAAAGKEEEEKEEQ
jgi:PRTRC genetic system protein E